jgi:hypothetical protein
MALTGVLNFQKKHAHLLKLSSLKFALRFLIVYINFGCHSLLGYVRAAGSDKEYIYDHD